MKTRLELAQEAPLWYPTSIEAEVWVTNGPASTPPLSVLGRGRVELWRRFAGENLLSWSGRYDLPADSLYPRRNP